jgi:hypothetical protein
VTGTGRHQTPAGLHIPTPVQPIAVPFMMQPQPPAIHVHGGQGGSVGGEYIGAGAQVAQGRAHQSPSPLPSGRTSSKRPISFSVGLGFLKAPVVRYGLTVAAAVGATLGIHTVATPAAAPSAPRVVYLPAPAPVETTEPAAVAAAPVPPAAFTTPLAGPDAGARRAAH